MLSISEEILSSEKLQTIFVAKSSRYEDHGWSTAQVSTS